MMTHTRRCLGLAMILSTAAVSGIEAQRVGDARLAMTRVVQRDPGRVGTDTSGALRSSLNIGGAIGGGFALGVVGGAVGLYSGLASSHGCRGELCQLGPAAVGLVLGESLGVGLGTHLGSRGRGSAAAAMLVSTLIGFGGAYVGVASSGILLPFVPMLQFGTALAMER